MARTFASPQEIAEKQRDRLASATEQVRAGGERTTEAPTIKAAAQREKAIDKYTQAWRSGKTEARLRAVTLDMWKEATLAKVDRISSGINNAMPKLVDFHQQFQGFLRTHLAELDRMPSRTSSDMEQRMLANLRGIRGFIFRPGRGNQ